MGGARQTPRVFAEPELNAPRKSGIAGFAEQQKPENFRGAFP
jgi:hypothetical protein